MSFRISLHMDISLRCLPGVGIGVVRLVAWQLIVWLLAGAELWVTLQLIYRPAGAQTNDTADGRSTVGETETRHILWV